MKRFTLIDMLKKYFPKAHKEIVFKDIMIKFIEENPNCFERSLEVGHITASAWLLNKDCLRAILMHHMKLDDWFQLGGNCDGDSDVLAVALKEAQEESGIINISPISKDIFDIDIHLIPANKKEKEHYHYDVRFLLQVTSDEEVIQNNESKELRWIEKDLSLLPTANPSFIRMFNKWSCNQF